MNLTDVLKAAAKSVAAALVGFLAAAGIDIPIGSVEVVLTALFVGVGSIILNLVLTLLGKFSAPSWLVAIVQRFVPHYEAETPTS